jgi:hypothetical protein
VAEVVQACQALIAQLKSEEEEVSAHTYIYMCTYTYSSSIYIQELYMYIYTYTVLSHIFPRGGYIGSVILSFPNSIPPYSFARLTI